MSERDVRERDILVASNEYAYVQDLTKGDIVLYVGPTKISLSNTERMIVFRDGRFVPVRGEEASLGVQRFVAATSSQYIILENPPVDAGVLPVKGANSAAALLQGRKIVVPGPAQFPLWPGQRAKVINGHELEADEYLVTRVYDTVPGDDSPIGTEHIVRGTDVSFYVPRTGLEVVPEGETYVRKAIRLNKTQGLHLRAIADFDIDGEDVLDAGHYRAGQEIFIRDREGYFFPVSNIEVIGLVEREPVADKEGIYVRRFESGEISTVIGPVSYLPDPTREELVDREIDDELAELYDLRETAPYHAWSVYVPPSVAIMVVGPNKREVVIGPQTRILDYNDQLELLKLSTGRPKTDDDLLDTCFLQIDGNKVSDLVSVKTRDHVQLEILLSYRVSFDGESDRWFAVKNYVGLLCDHLGSIIRAAARSVTIERFHEASAELLRSAVLGTRAEGGKREGRRFDENGMWVYDVEVLDVRILDKEVEDMLTSAQRTAISSDISRKAEELRMGDERLREQVNQQIFDAQIATLASASAHEIANRSLRLERMATDLEVARSEGLGRAQQQADALRITAAAELEAAERRADIERRRLEASAASFREQMSALAPELIATLKMLGNQKLAGELSQHLSPLAILGGESVADVAGRLLEKLPLGPSHGSPDQAAATVRSILSLASGASAGESDAS